MNLRNLLIKRHRNQIYLGLVSKNVRFLIVASQIIANLCYNMELHRVVMIKNFEGNKKENIFLLTQNLKRRIAQTDELIYIYKNFVEKLPYYTRYNHKNNMEEK